MRVSARMLLLVLALAVTLALVAPGVSAGSLSERADAASEMEVTGPPKSFRIGPYKTIHAYAPLSDPDDETDGAVDYPYFYKQRDGKWTKVLSPWTYRMEEPHPLATNILKKEERAWQVRQSKIRWQRRRLMVDNDEDQPDWDNTEYSLEDDEQQEDEQIAAEKKSKKIVDRIVEKIERENARNNDRMMRLLRKEKRLHRRAHKKFKKFRRHAKRYRRQLNNFRRNRRRHKKHHGGGIIKTLERDGKQLLRAGKHALERDIRKVAKGVVHKIDKGINKLVGKLI